MADEKPQYSIVRLPEDQLAAIMAEMRKGVAADPVPPSRPPADFTGRDAALFREIVHDECEKLYARFKADQEQLFSTLRMPIDKDHINETIDKLRDMFALSEMIKSVTRSWWKEILAKVIQLLLAAIGVLWAWTSLYPGSGGRPH